MTVKSVLTANAAAGVSVTLRSSAEIAIATGTAVAPAVSRTAAGVSVARFIASENVTVTAASGIDARCRVCGHDRRDAWAPPHRELGP